MDVLWWLRLVSVVLVLGFFFTFIKKNESF